MLERLFPSITLRRERTRRQIAEEIVNRKAMEVLSEGIPTFARDRDEGSWGQSGTDREPLNYGPSELADMYETCLELSYHPGARGLLDTMETFVIGDTTQIVAVDDEPKVQQYWDDWAKSANWDMRSKEMFRRYLRDGDVFNRWFQPKATGGIQAEGGYLLTRFISPTEVIDPANMNNWGHHSFGIETDPDDVEDVVAYFRQYGYNDAKSMSPTTKWERIPASEVDHFKCLVDTDIKRGRSWLMGVAKYITMHEGWIEQRWQLNRLRNLFAVIGNIKGVSGSSMSDIKAKFTDTEGKTLAGEGTAKKMPRDALFLLSKGIDYDLKSLNLQASDAAEDGRNIQLLTCVGTSLPEYVVRGDASNANYSSTMVSESPMVKMFQKYQDILRYMFGVTYARVIAYGIATNQIPTRGKQTDPKTGKAVTGPTSLECQVEFPPLIHRDVKEETEALVMQRGQEWVSDQTASTSLGYDYETEKAEIEKGEQDDRERTMGDNGPPPKQEPGQEPEPRQEPEPPENR